MQGDLQSDQPLCNTPFCLESPQALPQAIGTALLLGDWREAGRLLLSAKDEGRYTGTWQAWLGQIPVSRAHAHRLIEVAAYRGPLPEMSFNETLAVVRHETRRETRRPISCVYFIRAEVGGPIKIGWAIDPKQRLREFQIGCPIKLMLVATMEGGQPQESRLHHEFAPYRLHGEWFKPSAGLLKLIRECREDPIPAAIESARDARASETLARKGWETLGRPSEAAQDDLIA